MDLIRSEPTTTLFLQDACLKHQFIRSKDNSNIVERPERLRAVNVGISVVIARCEADIEHDEYVKDVKHDIQSTEEDLAAALQCLDIESRLQYPSPFFPLRIVKSIASLDILNHPAVKFVHGDIEGDVYLENLLKWAKESRDKIASDGTEIPKHLPQGDLYCTFIVRLTDVGMLTHLLVCPTSIDAIQGALATVCEAVDTVVPISRLSLKDSADEQGKSSGRSFVAVRPPGHHCGEVRREDWKSN